MRTCVRRRGCYSTLILLSLACTPVWGAGELEKQLLKHAPAVLKSLRDQGCQNVGVLKFRVKKGNEPATDRAGTLNIRLAEKLELALILANSAQDPVGVIRNASRTAAGISGASHLTQEGRQQLFTAKYPLAWGDEEVVPDAFLTGAVLISQDLRTMTVGIMAFRKAGDGLEQLVRFDVRPDLEDLLESGESFTVRGIFDQGTLRLTQEERQEKATAEAVQASTAVKAETATATKPVSAKLHPLSPENSDSPIGLEIQYDGQPQSIEFREGAAFLPEPQEGQKVVLVVRRKGADRSKLGIVVKVNGESTLDRLKLPDAQCRVWVMGPEQTEFALQGFYVDDKTLLPFKVLSQAESKSREVDYGEFVGTISVSVFPEQKTKPKPSTDLLTDEGEDFLVLTRSAFPDDRPKNFGALRQQLTQSATRGLIAEGAAVEQELNAVEFTRDSIPVMTATIRYYNPQDLPE